MFDIADNLGILPPRPPEIADIPLEIVYIGPHAIAQKAVATASIDQLIAHISIVRELNPDAVDKVNVDRVVDGYSDMLGVPPDMINDADTVAAIRAERNRMIQQQQMAQQVTEGANAAKILSDTPLGDATALDVMTGVA